MGLDFDYEDGQTPLEEEEKDDLLISTITTRSELNEFEQLNIEDAVQFYMRRKYNAETLLTEKFIKSVHAKMYGNVWKWAGSFRNSNKNLGVDKFQIGIELRKLMDDCQYWIKNKSFSTDEIATRFKHRIVSIHCFVNGNGRHSRFIADLIMENIFKEQPFTWGAKKMIDNEIVRKAYLLALKAADKGDYTQLITFAKE